MIIYVIMINAVHWRDKNKDYKLIFVSRLCYSEDGMIVTCTRDVRERTRYEYRGRMGLQNQRQ